MAAWLGGDFWGGWLAVFALAACFLAWGAFFVGEAVVGSCFCRGRRLEGAGWVGWRWLDAWSALGAFLGEGWLAGWLLVMAWGCFLFFFFFASWCWLGWLFFPLPFGRLPWGVFLREGEPSFRVPLLGVAGVVGLVAGCLVWVLWGGLEGGSEGPLYSLTAQGGATTLAKGV